MLGLLGRFFALLKRSSKMTSKKQRKKCENRGFGPFIWVSQKRPKTFPKWLQNGTPKKHLNCCFRFLSKKLRKSMVLASQTPPKTMPKRLRKRCLNKHAIFQRFWLEKAFVARAPTSISYWFFQYEMAFGRFSSNRFSHGFGVQKTIQKPLKNHARATQKSISKTCCFLTSIFSRFGLDFGASWASKMEPSPPRCLQRQAC